MKMVSICCGSSDVIISKLNTINCYCKKCKSFSFLVSLKDYKQMKKMLKRIEKVR